MFKLTSKVRSNVNRDLANLCRVRHYGIPLSDITTLLAGYGLKIEECLICGTNSNANLDVLTLEGQEVNSWLCLSWLKGDHDGKWEVNAYLS